VSRTKFLWPFEGNGLRSCRMEFDRAVMPAPVAGIHVLDATPNKDVDGRNKSGHDGLSEGFQCIVSRVG